MSDNETKVKKSRKPNPFVAWKKAQHLAEKARRAHARAEELAVAAKAAAEKAAALAAQKEELEAAEQAALSALQEALGEVKVDTDELAGE